MFANVLDAVLVPLKALAPPCAVQSSEDVRRYGAAVACFCDDGSPLIQVRLLTKALHALWAEPAGVTVEVVLAYRMTRDKVNAVALFMEPQGDLSARYAASNDNDPLAFKGPAFELGLKNVMDAL